jgi:hypothetical protein
VSVVEPLPAPLDVVVPEPDVLPEAAVVPLPVELVAPLDGV